MNRRGRQEKIAITVTCLGRPSYLWEMVESLRVASGHATKDYLLIAGIEPSDFSGECEKIIRGSGIQHAVIHNHERLGVGGNALSAMSYAFYVAECDSCVYLEEDLVVSPDTLLLCEWYASGAVTHSPCLCLNLFNYASTPEYPETLTRFYGAVKHGEPINQDAPLNDQRPHRRAAPWNSLGLCVFKEKWEEHMKPVLAGPGRVGWNWEMGKVLCDDRLMYTLMPELSRTNHIGEEGFFMSRAKARGLDNMAPFRNLDICTSTPFGKYRVNGDWRCEG